MLSFTEFLIASAVDPSLNDFLRLWPVVWQSSCLADSAFCPLNTVVNVGIGPFARDHRRHRRYAHIMGVAAAADAGPFHVVEREDGIVGVLAEPPYLVEQRRAEHRVEWMSISSSGVPETHRYGNFVSGCMDGGTTV